MDIFSYDDLDFDEIKKKLDIEKNAQLLASDEKPRTDSLSISSFEQKITAYFYDKLADVKQKVHDKLSIYTSISNKIPEVNNLISESKFIFSQFETDVKEMSENFQNNLNEYKDNVKTHAKDLKTFKINNKLNREANYPESKVLYIGLVLFIVLLETGGFDS